MKKKILILSLILATLAAIFSVVAFATDTPEESTLTIEAANLSFEDSVYVLYAVSHEGIDAEDVRMLFWTAPQDEYTVGTEAYAKDFFAVNVTVDDKSCTAFKNNELRAKNMADNIYARAYANVDGKEYYSEVSKYSILQYAYNKLGKTGTMSESEALRNMLTSMLAYGADAQVYFEHNTARPADGEFYQVKVEGGVLEDGFSKGLYLASESATLSAPETKDGMVFSAWKNSQNEIVSYDNPLVVDNITKNEVYIACYATSCAHGRVEILPAVAPTCTETGLTEGKYCLTCGEVLVAQEVVAASHEWESEYASDKGHHWQICSLCEEVKAKEAHTLDTDGYCTVCGKPIGGSDGVFYWPSDDGTYAEVIDYSGTSTRVVIAEEYEGLPVTHIAQNAFENKGITSIVLPSTLTHIGASAFSGCSALQSIIVPNSVVDIASKAFYGCSALTSVIMGGSVTSIGSNAFYYCSKLSSVSINNLVSWCNISFGNSYANPLYYAHNFYVNDTLVKELVIPEEITVVKAYAFAGGSRFETIVIHDNVTQVGTSAFQNCSGLTTVTLPAFAITGIPTSNLVSVTVTSGTSIASSAFKNCRCLKSVTLAQSVTDIGSSAFYGCSALETIVFPEDLVSIGSSAFYGCTKLIETVNGVSYVGDYLIGFDNSSALVAVRAGTKIIAASAFSGCSKLRLITFPDTVKSICDSAFYNCTNMTSITIPDSVTRIGSSAFGACTSLTSIAIPDSVTSIVGGTFYGCSSLESLTLPFVGGSKSATRASSSTLFGYIFGTSGYTGGVSTEQYCGSSYTTYYIPSSLKAVTITGGNIFYGAFFNCANLTSVTIGNSVTEIGSNAFYGCNSLITKENGIHYVDKWIVDCDTDVTVANLRADTKGIADEAFSNCSKLTSVTIGSSVTSIGSYAFEYCSNLTSVNIPDSVTEIGYGAFYNCSNLTSVNIPDSVTEIGSSAFYNCTKLTSVIIPDSVTSIGSYAFYSCDNLTSVTIGNSVTSIGKWAFAYCTSLTSITIGDSVISIGEHAFYDCDSVTSVIIPDSVTSIGDRAFYDCSSLTSVIIGNSVAEIGSSAFYNCKNLKSIKYRATQAEWNSISKGSYWNQYYNDGYCTINYTMTYNYTEE